MREAHFHINQKKMEFVEVVGQSNCPACGECLDDVFLAVSDILKMRKAKQTGLTDISYHLNLGRRGLSFTLGQFGSGGVWRCRRNAKAWHYQRAYPGCHRQFAVAVRLIGVVCKGQVKCDGISSKRRP